MDFFIQLLPAFVEGLKITLFFWITFVDAMLTAWALASSVSAGTLRPHLACEWLFVIALAVLRLASARSDGLLRRASVRLPA